MNLIKFLKARKTATNPAKINLRNALAVLQAWWRRLRNKGLKSFILDGVTLPQHIWEQKVYRMHILDKMNSPCLAAGSCVKCACDIFEKTLEDRPCERGCYPEMMSKEVWEVYKELNNIKLFE